MLCSVPGSSGKSTSGWLSRLRSSKGFPPDTDLNLDQFLTKHHKHKDAQDDLFSVSSNAAVPSQPEPSSSRRNPAAGMPIPSQNQHAMCNIVSNVLAELFVMEGSDAVPKLKCSRKQPNPRFCGSLNSPAFSCINNNDAAALSTDHPAAKIHSASASPVSNEGLVKFVENLNSGEEDYEDEEAKGKGKSFNLSGFSRTEVTVIDTSVASWKFEKMLFRKKNVWKVRDKKGSKTANLTKKKKRKMNDNHAVGDDDENASSGGGSVKKAKVVDVQCGVAASQEGHHQSNKLQKTYAMTSDNFCKPMKKKQGLRERKLICCSHKKHTHKKMKKKGLLPTTINFHFEGDDDEAGGFGVNFKRYCRVLELLCCTKLPAMTDLLTTIPTHPVFPSPYLCRCHAPNLAAAVSLLPLQLGLKGCCFPSRRYTLSSKSSSRDSLLLKCTGQMDGFHDSGETSNTIKDIFRDPAVTLFSLFRQLGFDVGDVETLLNVNHALRVTPYEIIHDRLSCIQALGVTGIALHRVILKRSQVLTAPEMDFLLSFLLKSSDEDDDLDLKGKIEPAQIEHLLINATEPRLLFPGFDVKVRLLIQNGIPHEKLVHVLNKINLIKAICVKSSQEIDRMFAFLGRFGGVDLILKRPAILNCNLDSQLMPRINFLLDLSGGDEVATATVLLKLPFLVAYSVDHLSDHVEFLKSFAGLTESEIFRIVLVYPNLFSASRTRKLHPRIEFLKQCGLSSQEIYRFLTKAPLFVALSFEENIACKLVFLVKIGYKYRTKEIATAMGAVTRTSCKNLQQVVGVFLDYGLTCNDILEMSKKHPQILQYNYESLEEKLNYLIEEMGREVEELLAFPAFLGYKLDGRIKPRYEMKKNILGEGMSLNKLLSVSAASFSNENKCLRD
ncbi:OLC1v1020931C1 [Oldenlandia corymbosa var. corymbosa]|uniref:OLC1v1020931C1 n=1 Tax=Oldenlandia corymbosa var. corymbosa TaxID=529605 RepID=A0AAV1BX08_OLDCO|nr:OLC1v1020931C1 [Oldenlandia corymbosa var. corymbosa]